VLEAYEAYFDESGTHGDSSLVCVAGYLFSIDGAINFTHSWEKEVRPLLPVGAEVFHAVDCVGHSRKFRTLTSSESERIFDAMVRIIKRTILIGLAVQIERATYDAEIKRQPRLKQFVGSAYSICAMLSVQIVSEWLDGQGKTGDVSYIYESGNEYEGEAAHFFSTIKRTSELKSRYRFARSRFALKNEAPPLQAADLLAWEWQRAYRTAMQPERSTAGWRLTLKSLCERQHFLKHISGTEMGITALVNGFYNLQSNRQVNR
jgi:hypothetical protein